MTTSEIRQIISVFQLEGNIIEIAPHGSGHIHETFHLKNENPDADDYILQKINHSVFKNVEKLMENIELVTRHLRAKVAGTPGGNSSDNVLTLVSTISGTSYYKHDDGSYWRVYLFLKKTKSYDLVENPDLAFEGGRAYGRFQSLLADLDAARLFEVLPNFHNIEYRLNLFDDALKNDPVKRVPECAREIAFVREKQEKMTTILNWGRAGLLPVKTTHNDTKFNNVLLDENNKAQCVIDLDTVMPGYVAYDFGDAIRTIVNTAEEDEKDLGKIGVNMPLFESFASGFISESINGLNERELESLAHGCLLLPFIIGLRFLTDHLDGDNYYKIHFAGHNLQRARAQFRLVEKLEEQFQNMQEIIRKVGEVEKAKLKIN